jgi:hypothetical protein
MLRLFGRSLRFCDGMPRRTFMRIGGLAFGGLSLPSILRAEAEDPSRTSRKSIIMIYLPGGPSHLDMYDPKPEAPAEIRGEFRPIRTSLPGVSFCEHLPRLAALADKIAVIRALVGATDDHDARVCLTGWSPRVQPPAGGWPSYGSVAAKWAAGVEASVPPYVSVSAKMEHHPYNDPGPGFLGVGYAAYTPYSESRNDLVLRGIGRKRFDDRRELLTSLDGLRRDIDASGMMHGMDRFSQQALSVLTSQKLLEALDLDREDPRVRARYGRGDARVEPTLKAAPSLTEHLLLARRLVEAGVRCVTVAFSAWDWHEKNFASLKHILPLFDQGVSALVEDLHQRGLDQDVSVVVWGEFGRSPRVNKTAGRDHWPAVAGALLAGGGLRTGQVLGATNRLGEVPRDRPVHYQEVLATLYQRLGLDLQRTAVVDLASRPQYLVGDHQPIQELI